MALPGKSPHGQLDVERGGPLYQQLRQDLFARIRRGEFPPGALLPSEHQICAGYRVSVTTARRALLELVKEGVVRRKAGVGTIVTTHLRRAHIAFAVIDDEADAWREVSAAMAEMIAGIGEQAWRRDSSFATARVDEEGAVAHLAELGRARAADGILLRTSNDISEEQLGVIEAAGLPYVIIKRDLLGRRMNCVVSDDYHGAREMVQHLIDNGHRRIAFVCAKPQLTLTQQRLGGYRDAMAGAGLGIDQALVRLDTSFTEAAGYEAARSLLLMPDRPTAIFTASDTMAIGAYRATGELGLAIPGQVAIAGYDGIGSSALLHPPLTTVLTSYYEFGRRSTELLLDLIDGRLRPPQRVIIPHRLLIRESTAKPPPRVAAATPSTDGAVRGPVADRNGLVRVQGGAGQAEFVAQILRADGWTTVAPDSATGPAAPAVLVLDLRQRLEEALEQASSEGEAMARATGSQPGVLLLLGIGAAAGTAVSAGARAGMEEVVRSLSARWGGRGLRVNALLAADAGVSLAGPCRFLLSEAATGITGQVLVLGDEA